jgi:translation initiation factor IF-2
MSMDFSFHFH